MRQLYPPKPNLNGRQDNNRAKKSGLRGFDNSQGLNFPFPFFHLVICVTAEVTAVVEAEAEADGFDSKELKVHICAFSLLVLFYLSFCVALDKQGTPCFSFYFFLFLFFFIIICMACY